MELALIVGDRYQNQGLGTRLSECLLEVSRAVGARRVAALIHFDNYAMREIARRLGLKFELDLGGCTVRATLEISR